MLDVYFLSDYDRQTISASGREGRTFSLDNYGLFRPGFEFLHSKTGVYIDEYGDVRVYPAHQRILLEYWPRSFTISQPLTGWAYLFWPSACSVSTSFGVMADATPPVALAAAPCISGGDLFKTGVHL